MSGALLVASARAAATALLCWWAVVFRLPAGRLGVAAHNLGLLLTMVFGILAATWWRHSAVLADHLLDKEAADPAVARDVNTLNAAAATATGLGLIASGFTSLRWGTEGAWVCAGTFVLVMAALGEDLHVAAAISGRRLLGRSVLSGAIIVAMTALFIWRRGVA